MDMPQPGDVAEEDSTPKRGLSPSRLAQLHRDMLLTPEERVRAADATLALDRLRGTGLPRGEVVCFDTYEDYLDYKWKRSTGGE
jgi:hypothetical protein